MRSEFCFGNHTFELRHCYLTMGNNFHSSFTTPLPHLLARALLKDLLSVCGGINTQGYFRNGSQHFRTVNYCEAQVRVVTA
jgi:hypothetical protein